MQPNRRTHVAPFSTRGHSLTWCIDVCSAGLSVSGILICCGCRFVGLGGKLRGLVRTHRNFVLFSARTRDTQRLLTWLCPSVSPSVCMGGIFSKMYRLLPISVKLGQKSQTLWSSMNWYLKMETCCVLCEVRNNWWFIRLVISETKHKKQNISPFAR